MAPPWLEAGSLMGKWKETIHRHVPPQGLCPQGSQHLEPEPPKQKLFSLQSTPVILPGVLCYNTTGLKQRNI